MPTRAEWLALAERIEAAAGADRGAVFRLGTSVLRAAGKSPLDPNPLLSLDAAASLVPEGWAWSLYGGTRDEGHATAYCIPRGGALPWPKWVEDIKAATPALALAAAACRARAEDADG